MKTATFEYKCRRCGEVTTGASTSFNPDYLLICVASHYEQPDILGGPLHETSLHWCKDKGCGIADIVGYKIDEN